MFPLVSIITINYNQTQISCELLQSIEHIDYPNIEVIVVDNGSSHNPKEIIEKRFPRVKVIVSPDNLGFSGGNNLGIQAAKGEFFFLVNNDTELTPQCVHILVDFLERHSRVGMVCPKIRYFYPPQLIQYVGYTTLNPITARNATIGQYEEDKGQYSQPRQTPYAHGAAMMLRREVVEKAGLMPEEFFLYYEELDWSEKIRKAGYEIYVEPQATIFHKESVSTGKASPLKTYYLTRNRILFVRRNAPWWQQFLFFVYVICLMIPKNVITMLWRNERKHLQAFVHALQWHWAHR